MHTSPKILDKVRNMVNDYYALAYETVGKVDIEFMQTKEHLRTPPTTGAWKRAKSGQRWGGDWVTGWFRGRFKVPAECAGQTLYLAPATGGHESMVWIDGEPKGMINGQDRSKIDSQHTATVLSTKARKGRVHTIAIEAYAWHPCVGTQPRESRGGRNVHTFTKVTIARRRDDVWGLAFDLRVLTQLMDVLDENSSRKGKLIRGVAEVFNILPQLPSEMDESVWRPAVARARKILAPLLKSRNGPSAPFIALTGHSHMDTAWLWPVAETERKCARTYANAVALMDEYPKYRFIQSSSYHGDMMRRLYPQIFRKMRAMAKAGRWEPNGGSWVEPDCNVIGAEALVRQFLIGQTATRQMYKYTSDAFWMPDTFGYSAALPQILQSCGIRYFYTTKLSWNDTNRFPYDTFLWKGLDGTSVLAHFNVSHCWPDPQTLTNAWNGVMHKDTVDRRLCSYGFGDGGGGPFRSMVEVANRVEDLEGCPKSQHMSTSEFMKGLERDCKGLPEWKGELYLELHRGTLTSIAGVKRGNRKSEIALRNAEALCALASLNRGRYPLKELNALWKKLLVNQFHDILPGTSIPEVNDLAIREFAEIQADAFRLQAQAMKQLATAPGTDAVEIHNTLSWTRAGEIAVDWPDKVEPSLDAFQIVPDMENRRRLILNGANVPAFGSTVIPVKKSSRRSLGASPFKVDGDTISTPHAEVTFDRSGAISSFRDRASGRELVRDRKNGLNTFWIGQDVPKAWDNWDIDEDQRLQMTKGARLISRTIVADGPFQLRMRMKYELGRKSRLTQEVVFHADSPQVDFETQVDWNETHMFLKAGFDVDVQADRARHEIQFGHAQRNTHTNLSTDRACFESVNHRWTDLSEPDFGVAVLNDCKYGVSVAKSDIRLSLLKAGTHPDPRGDKGVHRFSYAFLPHNGPFSAEAVIRPAYEFNVPLPTALVGRSARPKPSLLSIDTPGVIVESVKSAEDGNGLIVRLYEAEGCRAHVVIDWNGRWIVEETDMLENPSKALAIRAGRSRLMFRPFEIKTLRCTAKK